ncbi:MAG TPA: protein tyrosine phosphatase family protein [Vicinamibacterales bacterium]|nr:protein tyrosine phosphatase family protein [Vicinamibacterales bacterium]
MYFRLPVTRRSIAAVAAAISLALPVAAYAGGPSNAPAVSGATVRIDNFGRIDAHYYRGSQPEGRDYTDLAAIGVKTIINLTSDDAQPNEKALTEQAGMSYVQIPMTMHRAPTEAQLAEFFRVVDDPARQPVFVHCVGGKHRTGVMTAAYRIAEDHWTADQAFKEMKDYHFGMDFLHSEFKNFVFGYHPDTRAAALRAVATKSSEVQQPLPLE